MSTINTIYYYPRKELIVMYIVHVYDLLNILLYGLFKNNLFTITQLQNIILLCYYNAAEQNNLQK